MPPATDPAMTDSWEVVVPVKNLQRAKSRLGLVPDDRIRLMIAFATDVVEACQSSPLVARVTVVADESWRSVLPQEVGIVQDPGPDLNGAVRTALASLPAGARAAVVVGDLPCARADEVAALLTAARTTVERGGWAAVPDHAGVGTTVLLGGRDLDPMFGRDSYRRHRAAGAVGMMADAWSSLRLDVDDDEDVMRAAAMGVGAATRVALERLRPSAT